MPRTTHLFSSSSSSSPCTVFYLLLFLSPLLHAAILPSQQSSASTSGSGSSEPANQRSARSTSALLTREGAEEDQERDGEGRKGECRADFVEEFFRVLSGPVGKEAEAVVAAVLKLLSENDRVGWKALAPQSPLDSFASEDRQAVSGVDNDLSSMSDTTLHVPSPYLLHRLREKLGPFSLPSSSSKRASPKFNPTGWKRKKRSTRPLITQSEYVQALKHILRDILEKHASVLQNFPAEPSRPDFAEPSMDGVSGSPEAEMTSWRDRKRSNRQRMLRRRQHLKRKPLEFNPTGW